MVMVLFERARVTGAEKRSVRIPVMALSVSLSGVYTLAADIYSVGMLMYEVAAGHPPFLGLATDFRLACANYDQHSLMTFQNHTRIGGFNVGMLI